LNAVDLAQNDRKRKFQTRWTTANNCMELQLVHEPRFAFPFPFFVLVDLVALVCRRRSSGARDVI
jgi:hypothetical protein